MVAHIKETPKQIVKNTIRFSFFTSVTATFFMFLILRSQILSLSILPFVFILVFIFTSLFILQTPKVYIRKREMEINKEVLFAVVGIHSITIAYFNKWLCNVDLRKFVVQSP